MAPEKKTNEGVFDEICGDHLATDSIWIYLLEIKHGFPSRACMNILYDAWMYAGKIF